MTGSGTSGDPYIISDADDLQAMENNLAAYYELGGNIDASATSGWNGGAGFDPIILFAGQLDGKGYTISDLFINRPAEAYVGLIGYTNASIVLRNISMTGVDITGQTDVGALLGYDNGGGTPDIDDCNSAGAVEASNGQVGGLIGMIRGGAVDDCWSSCTVVNGSGGYQTGGLIGYNISAAITSCYATGSVTASDSKVGGLIGCLWDGVISKCYATGNVSGINWVGGLIGHVDSAATLDDCYARGNATADAAVGSYAGGLVGKKDAGTIDNCYSTGAATGSSSVGGLTGSGSATDSFWDTETSGNATSSGGTGKTTAEMKAIATFADAGWDFTTIWAICAGINGDYPCLIDITPSCSLVTVVAPTVSTNSASAVGQTSATLNGKLSDDGGEACDCSFEYGETEEYGTETATQSKETDDTFEQEVRGLRPGGILYHFRAIATNSAGTSYGADQTFSTSALSAEAHQALGKAYALGRHGL